MSASLDLARCIQDHLRTGEGFAEMGNATKVTLQAVLECEHQRAEAAAVDPPPQPKRHKKKKKKAG